MVSQTYYNRGMHISFQYINYSSNFDYKGITPLLYSSSRMGLKSCYT